MADAQSIDTADWSETPETNYFKMMMEDNQMGRVANHRHQDNTDDSVIGGATLASILPSPHDAKDSVISSVNHQASDVQSIDSYGYSMVGQESAPTHEAASAVPSSLLSHGMDMSIVGLDDDVSTIANDTVNQDTKAFFFNRGGQQESSSSPPPSSSRQISTPRIRLFKEYRTPEKKKSKRSQSSTEGEDDATAPETPPGMIRVPSGKKKSKHGGSGQKDGSDHPSSSKSAKKDGAGTADGGAGGGSGSDLHMRSKRVYIVAGVLAVILFASIIALAVALKGMRKDDSGGESSAAASSSSNPATGGGDASDVPITDDVFEAWPDLGDTGSGSDVEPPVVDNDEQEETPSDAPQDFTGVDGQPVEAPTEVPPVQDDGTQAPSVELPHGEFVPTAVPTSITTTEVPTLNPSTASPSASPSTNFPSLSPTVFEADPLVVFTDMMTLLVDQGALSPDVVDSPESPQYQALEWLSLDPNFYDYSEERATQRYVLAVMATSLQPVGAGRRRLELGGWMDYTDECTWFSSSSSAVCNDAGLYRTIDIQDIELDGELPAEIALLSNSLTSINMDRNNLQGQIPAEFGDLSLLEVLSLRQNSLDGFLTTNIGLLENLSILDLGRNDLSGEIPAEIGWMRSLRVLALDNNRFTGEIPRDIGDLSENLVELALNDNFFSGRLPNELSRLENLEVLMIGNNTFTGEMPRNFCRLDELEFVSVDCQFQGECDCCTECTETSAPTATPVVPLAPIPAPTIFPVAPTTAPVAPTSAPVDATGSPTITPPCVDSVSIIESCLEPWDSIQVALSNCNPEDDDWLGVYSASLDLGSLPNPTMWSWTCGGRDCREAVETNTFVMGQDDAGNGNWPLDEGTYMVVMARNSAQPYTAYARSASFTIQESC